MIGSILLGLALLIAVAVFISRPLWMPDAVLEEHRMTRRQALEAQKAVLLDEIRAVDFDYETGKLPADVHERERAYLVAEAAEVLKQLDQLGARPTPAVAAQSTPKAVSAPPAAAVAVKAAPADEIEAAIARIRQERRSTTERPKAAPVAVAVGAGTARFCSYCGEPRAAEDKFCAYCGERF